MSIRLSYANVTASIAMFVALGGASYAALSIPANSVGSKQLKRNAVTTAKVKDHSLLAADFAAGQMPAGAAGDTGPAGPKGDRGAAGDTGAKGDRGAAGDPAGFPATLPSGKTETGAFGAEDKSSVGNGDGYATDGISFTIPLATAPGAVIVPAGTTATHCTGTAATPTAAAGYLCVYIGGSSAGSMSLYSPDAAPEPSAGTTGAIFGVHNPVDAFVYGSWAVTAA